MLKSNKREWLSEEYISYFLTTFEKFNFREPALLRCNLKWPFHVFAAWINFFKSGQILKNSG